MSAAQLPERPNLEHLKKQAKDLLERAQQGDSAALARFREAEIDGSTAKLADAQHAIARQYDFSTWMALKLHVESLSDNPADALLAAIRNKDAAAVGRVLAAHPDFPLNEPLPNYNFDQQAIFAALHTEDRNVIEALLAAGADINARTRWWAGGFGVLDWGSPELSEWLIERGAYVDIHAAARLGKIERVGELLAEDPSLVHARGGDGQTPLHFASTPEIAALLLDAGAEIDARDIDHESTAAQYAACNWVTREGVWSQRHDVARYLLSRGATPDILMASSVGAYDVVEHILDDDPDAIRITVNEKYFPRRDPRAGGTIYLFGFGVTKTPHMLAREAGHEDVFNLLMRRSPNWLRLVQAAEVGDVAMAESILARHPGLIEKLNERTSRRLIGVAARSNTKAVQLLIDHGWPVNTANENNQTPLHWAAWHGNAAMTRALLAKGADFRVEEREHNGTPLGWALHGANNSWMKDKGDYPATVRALLNAGAELPGEQEPIQWNPELKAVVEEWRGKVSS